MRELLDDPFYDLLRRYPDCLVDYVLLRPDRRYRGVPSHREALAFAMNALAEREGPAWASDFDRAEAREVGLEDLLAAPSTWRKDRNGTVFYDLKHNPDGGGIPYWYAFLEPPHGTGTFVDDRGEKVRRSYTPDDFRAVNRALFPSGTKRLVALEWTTDWSEYFDDGHEWWGAACWTVYDPGLDRFAVIMASATD